MGRADGPIISRGDEKKKRVAKRILIAAALLACSALAAYACTYEPWHFSACFRLAIIGAPGILLAAALSIALLGGHGGGPLGVLLVVETPINFLLYTGLGMTVRKLLDLLKDWNRSRQTLGFHTPASKLQESVASTH